MEYEKFHDLEMNTSIGRRLGYEILEDKPGFYIKRFRHEWKQKERVEPLPHWATDLGVAIKLLDDLIGTPYPHGLERVGSHWRVYIRIRDRDIAYTHPIVARAVCVVWLRWDDRRALIDKQSG